MSESIATGAVLNSQSFSDFVARLKYHCRGDGVNDHCTADALFVVQERRRVIGIDREYTDNLVAYSSDGEVEYYSPEDYFSSLSHVEKVALNKHCVEKEGGKFKSLKPFQQWEIMDGYNELQVAGFHEYWEYVNSHFTKEAAESFIRRKKHDYRDGLRIYVEAQSYCWEFNAVKEAIMNGQIVFKELP